MSPASTAFTIGSGLSPAALLAGDPQTANPAKRRAPACRSQLALPNRSWATVIAIPRVAACSGAGPSAGVVLSPAGHPRLAPSQVARVRCAADVGRLPVAGSQDWWRGEISGSRQATK